MNKLKISVKENYISQCVKKKYVYAGDKEMLSVLDWLC